MHKLRVLIAILLGIVIIRWLAKRYQQYPDREVVDDPFQPVRDKVALLTDKLGFETPGGIGNTDQKPPKNKAVRPFHEDFSTGMLTVEELNTIVRPNELNGPQDAQIVLVQYCDFGSRYCLQGYEEGAALSYREVFPEQLAYVYKPYPRSSEKEAILPHQAVACVGELTDKEKFLEYYTHVYDEKGKLNEQELLELAERLSIRWLETCLQNANTLQIQQEMKNWRELFGFTSLPANVFIDTRTGRRLLVPGLYEIKEVIPAVQRLLKQK